VLTRLFLVPEEPPHLPTPPGEATTSFRPAAGFLRSLKFQFWIGLGVFSIAILIGWIALVAAEPAVGILLTPVAAALVLVPNALGYVAIHLRFDTTWYVMSRRSLRIRRGIWTIHETTITFENVQNVIVDQGPLQRIFGIANVLVETAGGGGVQAEAQTAAMAGHRGLIEGVSNAAQIRELLLERLRLSKTGGLGDEPAHLPSVHPGTTAWGPEHVAVLREIRDLLPAALDASAPAG
jgi:membrane protein YdbS with pleckstrin-like domain